jgi:hypothetical protein
MANPEARRPPLSMGHMNKVVYHFCRRNLLDQREELPSARNTFQSMLAPVAEVDT